MYIRVLEEQSRRGTPEGEAAYAALIQELLEDNG